MNLHAIELKKILLARGFRVLETGSTRWQVSNGTRSLIYGTESGTVQLEGSLAPYYGRKTLRGSPATIAGVIEELLGKAETVPPTHVAVL